ncbi:hypothetical protein FT663_01055 [Candidozyma haemuli var. vulneris]|uniref:U3 small nucleolar RNA-associated protein 6 N-terminal domain-containing protein n=1 Tax=Candidozyma haemuli TaxID=45357 RepID=A0A2V1AUT2_9ASCO|nr:hypothetical protein CXQ85_000258 [[Candida] haemuloni]KAF3990277.1 hypothetical protein FT662_02371 [[Candida] haemuloni var. vulneris]KAF3994825.1 hypothetical protein FT663_01055 [[Candida] haemuloni var. vulneris]PVH21286.1 hypothetical protein CXQ85_000258 [[Candida] haemuloni]
MSSKIRFYMESSVPELEDLKRKGLFDQKEITMIMRRRTDFEHRIQGRGAKPRDFLKYADFEINLEKLRVKRFFRLRETDHVDTAPSISDWAGFRKIIFIFDRAVRRFSGDLDIWAKYLQFVKDKDAIKVVYRVYAKLLSLQPRNVDAWLSAAKYEFETNANAKGARELYQKALRLNPESRKLWISYAQFELTYVSKLLARRQVLGLLTEKKQEEDLKAQAKESAKRIEEAPTDGVESNSDTITFADVEEDDLKSELASLPEADMNVLGSPETNPVLKGDIALTVFDLALPELLKEVGKASKIDKVFEIADEFLSVFDQFETLNRDHLNYHILSYLQTNYKDDIRTSLMDITLPLRNVSVLDSSLADALKLSVNKFTAYKSKAKDDKKKQELSDKFVGFLTEKFVNVEETKSEKTEALLKAIIQKCR